MATAPTAPKQDPRTIVRTSERLWSDVVGAADGTDVLRPREPAYAWSNGRVHEQPRDLYRPNEEPLP